MKNSYKCKVSHMCIFYFVDMEFKLVVPLICNVPTNEKENGTNTKLTFLTFQIVSLCMF